MYELGLLIGPNKSGSFLDKAALFVWANQEALFIQMSLQKFHMTSIFWMRRGISPPNRGEDLRGWGDKNNVGMAHCAVGSILLFYGPISSSMVLYAL